MCLSCISEMNQAFAFKQKCERSERTLRLYLEQVENETQNKSLNPRESIYFHSTENNGEETTESQSPSLRENECQMDDLAIQSDIYHCSNCSMEFRNGLEIESHVCKSAVDKLNCSNSKDQTESPMQSTPEKSAAENIVMEFIAENTLKFICSLCKASFSSRRSLSLHFNSRKCLQQSYECDICHKIFIKKRYLIRHLQRMHKMTNETHTVENTEESKTKSKRKYKCHSCPKGETIQEMFFKQNNVKA